ncbi:MAG TPA: bifunctional methylenetetrahydrofolate dehydrogenase/methenyltetrahydrofolate cyclohydrolase FolD [Deltaproteobacteria bacterium]|nr:bifunctional methylenetetrahydrofolate dehydrogenase/methenyltetrahydrofolate cyclohydrolase FolD [Deltaproteobacteria bacterium]
MPIIINGNDVAREIRYEIKAKVGALQEQRGIIPGLAVILVGKDPASRIYVRRKTEDCEEVGFFSREFKLPENTEEHRLLSIIDELNRDGRIHGILVQLPLPQHINANAIIDAINPRKDVDGFHPYNMGRLFTGDPFHQACTPYGIIELMDRHGIKIEGKNVVIVGRSNIVGKPLAMMLLTRHATVTVCHTRTKNLSEVTRRAEILVAAAGSVEMIKGEMVRDGAVVIDVGINRREDGTLVGDVAFSEVVDKTSYITPVPGGVGPMTRAMLLTNTYNAATRLSSAQ